MKSETVMSFSQKWVGRHIVINHVTVSIFKLNQTNNWKRNREKIELLGINNQIKKYSQYLDKPLKYILQQLHICSLFRDKTRREAKAQAIPALTAIQSIKNKVCLKHSYSNLSAGHKMQRKQNIKYVMKNRCTKTWFFTKHGTQFLSISFIAQTFI